MLEWKDYVKQLILNVHDFDNISISLDDGTVSLDIPTIIKTSITMLDKMIEHQGRLNFFVFPEKVDTPFIFSIMYLFHNIIRGKIKSSYDPSCFKIGEKLKVGNAVVEYLGTEFRNNQLFLMIKLADLDKWSAPIDLFPIFQKVETKRRLSKNATFVDAKKKALTAMHGSGTGTGKLSFVSDMKTHMNSSVFFMTSISSMREQLSHFIINGKRALDVFYLGQVDYNGKISNISSGQMSGVPAMVFASDLYAVDAAISNNAPVESIIIDVSNTNTLLRQLDALDHLIELSIPIVCITDVASSFELEQFQARGFNIWRWDKNTITEEFYGTTPLPLQKKTKNCARQTIKFINAHSKELTLVMKSLSSHKKETEDQSPQMMKLFEKLNHLSFKALRTTRGFSGIEKDFANRTLSDCKKLLKEESEFLNYKTIKDYQNIISNLTTVYTDGYVLQKEELIKNYFKECLESKIYLIIPDNTQIGPVQNYWDEWCRQNLLEKTIKVMSSSEYYALPLNDGDVTVICCWLKRSDMQKMIFGYNTSSYVVFLYDYEDKWRKQNELIWQRAFRNSSNKSIIEKLFAVEGINLSVPIFNEEPLIEETTNYIDELSEIELILHKNKFRQYETDKTRSENELVIARPIAFVGGYLAFCREGHKLISTTKIIKSESDKIETKLPSELEIGDFIVVREADRDIIRELADIILQNSGKSELRDMASKWREALRIELLFTSLEELYIKLKVAGCSRSLTTIKSWINDEDIIAPKSKEDLQFLAKVTENEVLKEKLDIIYDSAQDVRNAHILAGRTLSEQLKRSLAQELKKIGMIDPFNFWKPINLEIEGIGTAKVLKIIDIHDEIEVDSSNTNRLIQE